MIAVFHLGKLGFTGYSGDDYCIFQDSHGFPRIPKMGGMTWTIDCHGPMDHNYPVVNGGSDSERFGVFIFPVYSL